jgi:hypothetical protein
MSPRIESTSILLHIRNVLLSGRKAREAEEGTP